MPSLHLPGGLNFDPPGSTHCWCCLSLLKSSACNVRQHGILMKQVDASSNKSGGVCVRSKMICQVWTCIACVVCSRGIMSVGGAGGSSSGLSS